MKVYACATHGLFNGPALERIAESEIDRLIVTDTVAIDPLTKPDNVEVLTVAGILADTIRNVFADDSVSAIFAARTSCSSHRRRSEIRECGFRIARRSLKAPASPSQVTFDWCQVVATIRRRVRRQAEARSARARGDRLAPHPAPALAGAHPWRSLREGSRARDRRSGARAARGDDGDIGTARDPRRRDRGADDGASVDPRRVPAGSDSRNHLAHRSSRGAARPAHPCDRRRASDRRAGWRQAGRDALTGRA